MLNGHTVRSADGHLQTHGNIILWWRKYKCSYCWLQFDLLCSTTVCILFSFSSYYLICWWGSWLFKLIMISSVKVRNREVRLWDRRVLNSSISSLSLGTASGWVLHLCLPEPMQSWHWPHCSQYCEDGKPYLHVVCIHFGTVCQYWCVVFMYR